MLTWKEPEAWIEEMNSYLPEKMQRSVDSVVSMEENGIKHRVGGREVLSIDYDVVDEVFVEIEVIRDQEVRFLIIMETDEDGMPESSKLGIPSDITNDQLIEEFGKRGIEVSVEDA